MKRIPILAAATLWVQVVFPTALAAAPDFWDEIPLSPSTTMPPRIQDDYWNGEFQRVNREVAAAQNTRLVFFGDSITWSWSLGPATGREIWNEQYSRYQPINMGNSGDITPVMLYRATHGNLDFPSGRQPKVAVLLCGINNFGVNLKFLSLCITIKQQSIEISVERKSLCFCFHFGKHFVTFLC